MHLPKIRTVIYWLAVSIGILLVLWALHQLVLPVIAWIIPGLQTPFYDFAVYGAYPTRSYVSYPHKSPESRRLAWDESCDGGFVLLTPNGESVSTPGPMIVDSQGNLVWMLQGYGAGANLNVQQYQGKDYLTFWSGVKKGTAGKGDYYMVSFMHRFSPALD